MTKRNKDTTKKPRTSIALVRTTQSQVLPASLERLGEPVMSASFIGTLKLTEQQILALRRPVLDSEVEWKPALKDGAATIPYLSHNGYRDRLDAAFGLGGWGMVPVGMPKQIGDDFLYVPYALCIDGVPRVYAWGEQQMHKMTYGDAIEGTKSNAIVRCGKELGIARELWSHANVAALKVRKESIEADGTRRMSDRQTRSYHAQENEPITDPQRRRLWVIVKNSGRTAAEIGIWLKSAYGLDRTDQIKRSDYTSICETIERSGSLPREPGSDDE